MPKAKQTFFWIVAFSISVPLFLGLSTSGISIIQLWDRKDAFPMHISFPFIIILGFYYNAFRINSEKIIVFSFYIILITLCNFIYVSQLFLLFIFYYTFRSMPKNEFMDLVKKVVITALIFAAFHLTGYLLNMVIFKLGTKDLTYYLWVLYLSRIDIISTIYVYNFVNSFTT